MSIVDTRRNGGIVGSDFGLWADAILSGRFSPEIKLWTIISQAYPAAFKTFSSALPGQPVLPVAILPG